MSIRYNDGFKREVVRAYMAGNKSTIEIAAEYNIAKSTVSEWEKNIVKNANIQIPLQNLLKQNPPKK